jgi:hypothetical protein
VNLTPLSKQIIPITKPVLDRKGSDLYTHLKLVEFGPTPIVKLGSLLSGPPHQGLTFQYRDKSYLVTLSERTRLLVAPATIKNVAVIKELRPELAVLLTEGLKAQYVQVGEDNRKLFFVIEGDTASSIDLELSDSPYEITGKVRKITPLMNGKVLWVSSISTNKVTLSIAEENQIFEIEDGKPAFDLDHLELSDHELSVWDQEFEIDQDSINLIPKTENHILIYTKIGELYLLEVKEPCNLDDLKLK